MGHGPNSHVINVIEANWSIGGNSLVAGRTLPRSGHGWPTLNLALELDTRTFIQAATQSLNNSATLHFLATGTPHHCNASKTFYKSLSEFPEITGPSAISPGSAGDGTRPPAGRTRWRTSSRQKEAHHGRERKGYSCHAD